MKTIIFSTLFKAIVFPCFSRLGNSPEPAPSPSSPASSGPPDPDYVDEATVKVIASRTTEDEILYLVQSFMHVALNQLQWDAEGRLIEIDVALRLQQQLFPHSSTSLSTAKLERRFHHAFSIQDSSLPCHGGLGNAVYVKLEYRFDHPD